MSLTRVSYSMINGAAISVKDFGAVGDGVTDDTRAIQDAVNFAEANPQYKSYTTAVTGGEVVGGYMGKVYFPKGTYLINGQIIVSSVYLDVDFNDSVILKGSAFNDADFAFAFNSSWYGRVTNGSFYQFKRVFRLANSNLNTGRIDFDRMNIYGADIAFDIECRSSYVTVTDCRFITVRQVAIIRAGDQVSFRNSWFSAGVISANYGGHFEFVSPGFGAGLELVDMFYVPTPQTALKPCMVKVGVDNCRVTIDRGIYGAEPGSVPLIANYANATTTSGRGSQFTISNVMAYSSSSGVTPMIRLYALPNSIVFDNVYGFIEETHVDSLIAFDTTVQTFAAADAARQGQFQIHFVGRQINNFEGLPLANRGTLNKFVRSRTPISYGYAPDVTNLIAYSIPINAFTFPGTFRRGNVYRICISNPNNPGADRYSEYIVQADFSGAGVSIAAIKEGASTAAARLSTTGSDLQIKTNGFATASAFVFSIEKLADSTEGY